MTAEEFREAFGGEIGAVVARATRPYSVTSEEITLALYGSAKKYLASGADLYSETLSKTGDGDAGERWTGKAKAQVPEMLESLNADDLFLAVACAKGDESAWEDFFRDYRGYLVSIARTVTQDQGAAEQLADSTFAELYGLRESGGARVSKFSFYSGRGSLRGWLRAVVYQLSADLYRKTGRFVQTEEADDLERVPVPAAARDSGEVEFVGRQYEAAISESLKKAISQLDSRDRLLFAHYYYDEMTLREIGKLFGVHEATVCRWLAKAQKRTRKLVEKLLSTDHKFNRRQVSEALQVAADRADISIGDYLTERVASDRQVEEEAKSAEGQALSLRLD